MAKKKAAKKQAAKKTPKATPTQQKKVAKVMREFKRGELHSGEKGPAVEDRDQAVAIAMNEAGLSTSKKKSTAKKKSTSKKKSTAKKKSK